MVIQASTREGWQLEHNSAEAYERYLASAFSPWARALTELAEIGPGDRVLDVACGTGIVARHAAERAGASGQVVGVDLNEGMLAVARAVCASTHPSIEWRQGNVTALPFADASFDAVCCEQAMAFFSDPIQALREMRRVLTPRGRVAVSVCRPIAFCPAYIAMASALDRHVGAEAGAIMRSPFSAWQVDELRSLFTRAGFADVRVRIEVGSLRYPSCEEFLRQESASSPLAGPVRQLDGGARRALIQELNAALADHIDDDGVVCVVESYAISARRTAP